MKKILLIITLILLLKIEGHSQTKVGNNRIQTLLESEWLELKQMIAILKNEYRLTHSDASYLKGLSSDSYVAFEQSTDSIINQYGKIHEEDIKLAFRYNSKDKDEVIIITSFLGYSHSFIYNLAEKTIRRIPNRNSIISSGNEVIKLKTIDNTSIILYADNSQFQKGDWIKYFNLDLKDNTFRHWKNCRTNSNKEECNKINK